MMNAQLDRNALEHLIRAVGDRLPGRWLVVGGAFAALTLLRDRVTQDIDMIGLENTNAERLALMELAEQEGYPVETINSAVDYFIRKVDQWEQQLEVLYQGKKSTVYGPSLTLFIVLKVGRMSEQDYQDCVAASQRAREQGITIGWAQVRAAIDSSRELSDAARKRQGDLLALASPKQ